MVTGLAVAEVVLESSLDVAVSGSSSVPLATVGEGEQPTAANVITAMTV
jgi:hypothetical protein